MWEWTKAFWAGLELRFRHVALGFAAGLVIGAVLL